MSLDGVLNTENETQKGSMPYEITFSKELHIVDREQYFNDCCIGGDVVLDVLLPELRNTYDDLTTNQEDWGWFVWFREHNVLLAIDVFCDDPDSGSYRMHLTSSVPKWILWRRTEDSAELESLRERVTRSLAGWLGSLPRTTRVGTDYTPY